ncbi:MAG: hypothetical protein LQ349_000316 [Xanthoria aureola]|nr:MAG: hypothetical protein LQ349_000316 [Xanthoria aureola]
MSDQEHTSHLTNSQEDHTKSLPHTLAAECISSSPPVLDHSQPEQLQHLTEASPRSNPSHSDSEWTLIDSLTNPSTTQVEQPPQQPPDLKRRRSSASSSHTRTPPSARTGPTASQIAQRTELYSDLIFNLNKRAADEDCDSDRDDISQSCSDSDTSQLDMTINPGKVRRELEEDWMFINKGHLNDSGNAEFKKMVMKVMETDRTSVVSERDIEEFKEDYETYESTNEATLVVALLPTMTGKRFTAQDLDKEGQEEGEYKERSFVKQGVEYRIDHLFSQRYCLPTCLMGAPESKLKAYFDSKDHLTTPKPDWVYGLRPDKLLPPPSGIKPSEKIDELLKLAPIREVFFVWENKSGGGILMKCRNDALKDTAALIYARRLIHELMGRSRSPGIDKDTYMFAAVNSNERIEFYVAYAWVSTEDLSRVEFCMDKIGSEDFTIDELKDHRQILPSLRKPLHNIIEWGSVKRMPKLNKFYEELWAFERERSTRLTRSGTRRVRRQKKARRNKK